MFVSISKELISAASARAIVKLHENSQFILYRL